MTAGMPRELAAHHAPAVLTSPHVEAALAVHRAALAFSLVELLKRPARSGPARRAIKHARDCGNCGLGALCPAGARLARAIGHRRSRRRRGA